MIVNSDALKWMKTQSDCSVDCIVTDPPYGLAFMGKKWDYQLPSIEIWTEALRICKPGSWLLAFRGSRTYHRLTCSIEDAGWEIRDCIMWMHGQGFPKGKGCLKPSYEPIVVARKKAPKPELNIDECRIQVDPHDMNHRPNASISNKGKNSCFKMGGHSVDALNSKGRWPANIILDEVAAELLDQQSGILKSTAGKKGGQGYHNCLGREDRPRLDANEIKGHNDSGGASRSRFFYCAKASSSERNRGLDKFYSAEYNLTEISEGLCEENMVQVQSLIKDISDLEIKSLNIGVYGKSILVKFPKDYLFTIKMVISKIIELKIWNSSTLLLTKEYIQDVFAEKMDGINHVQSAINISELTMKIGILQDRVTLHSIDVKSAILKLLLKIKNEENWKEAKNFHSTVKPLKLMEYLIKLVAPKDGVILDPFCGSGTTLVAAKKLGYEAIGIELEADYCEIARARVQATELQLEFDL